MEDEGQRSPVASHAPPLNAEQFDALWPRSRGSGMKAIFLDYDGTLREFEKRPELAVPTQEIQKLLAALNARDDLLVHIISGRDADFLNTHLGAHSRVRLMAEHERRVSGRFQIWSPESNSDDSEPIGMESWKILARPLMTTLTAQIGGSTIEDKASSLVWHYRGVENECLGDNAAKTLVDQLEQLKREHSRPDITVSSGSKMVEVARRSVPKGKVVRELCDFWQEANGAPFEAVLVAGDDVSDESMFQDTPLGALTIKVGQQATTSAKFCVENPQELRALLWRIVS